MAAAGRLRRALRHLAPQDDPPATGTMVAAAAPLEPRMHAESDDASPGPNLTAKDIAFFKANGYLMKRRLLPAEDLAVCVEKFWAAAPPCIGPDDPDSWVDPGRHDSWATEAPAGYERGEHNRGGTRWTLHELGTDPEFLAATAHNPKALRVVEGTQHATEVNNSHAVPDIAVETARALADFCADGAPLKRMDMPAFAQRPKL